MTKIYEALEHGSIEVLNGEPEVIPPGPKVSSSSPPPRFSEMVVEKDIRVYQSLTAVVSDPTRKVIQFIGSREGEGTSTVVREFAKVSATKFGRTVLLLDADRYRPTLHLHFNIHNGCGWQEVVRDNEPIEKALYQIGETRLFVSPSSRNFDSNTRIFNSLPIDVFWKKLKQRFDLILVDSPPATTSTDGLAISSKVDGVVLVVEAEKTRWPVAETVRDRIKNSGGNILGIVLSKRRYYIPEWIYNKL